MLTCCIVICDKDYQYAKDCVNSILKNVKICDEILIADNREKKKNEPLGINSTIVKIIDMGGNSLQFAARAATTKAAKNKYVWHGDCDDLFLCDIDSKLLEKDFDVISGNVKTSKGYFGGKEIIKPAISLDNPNSIQIHFGGKIIKRDLLKKIFEELGEDKKILRAEDILINKYLEYYSKVNFMTPDIFYLYKENRASWKEPWKRKKEVCLDVINNSIMGSKGLYKIDKKTAINEYNLATKIAIKSYFSCKSRYKDEILNAILENFDITSILHILIKSNFKNRNRSEKLLIKICEKYPELKIDFDKILSD